MRKNGIIRHNGYKLAPPASEKRVEIQALVKAYGYSRIQLRRFCRMGLAVKGIKKTKGVRLPRVRLEHDTPAGSFRFTTIEAMERFLKRVNPGEHA